MRNKSLEINKPIVNTSNVYGTLFSIIPCNEHTESWVLSNFIQLRYVIDWDVYFFDNHDFLMDTCPYISKYLIDREFIMEKWDSFIDFIVYSISKDSYVWCHLDRFYIPAYEEYKKLNRFHETLIYGYDLDKKEVYISDNLESGSYNNYICTFKEIENAFKNVSSEFDFITRVHLIKKIDVSSSNFKFNREFMIDSIQRYLFSKTSFDLANPNVLCIYGINIYHHLISKVTHHQHKIVSLDIRAFHLLWEHKKLMVMRINYLIKISAIKDADKLIEGCKTLENRSFRLRNIVMKYNLSAKSELTDKIKNELFQISIMEQKILGEILEKL